MGGGTALYTAFAGQGEGPLGLAGVFSLSSWVSSSSAVWAAALPRAPPAFLAHGAADAMVPAEWGKATRDALTSRGVTVEWLLESGVAHEPGPASLDKLLRWTLNVLPAL